MAVKLIANYAKRLGLPGYSSHQFSVAVEVELANTDDIAGDSARLYSALQQSVDAQIRETGFVPPHGYGLKENGNGAAPGNGHHANGNGNGHADDSGISEKQLDLVSRIMQENNLGKAEVEGMSVEMFGGGVRTLNRMQASNLIDELFDKYPRRGVTRGKFQRPARA